MKRLHTQKFFSTWRMVTGLIITVVFFSVSCTSQPSVHTIQPFGVAGRNADVYLFAPVKGNEPLLQALLTVFLPEKTAAQYLSRTSAVYAGVQYGSEPLITVSSVGTYPVSLASFIFSNQKGWEKRTSTGENSLSYYRSANADVLLPASTIAYALLGGTDRDTGAFLKRVAGPEQPVFPPRFQSFVEEKGGQNGIGIYVRSAQRIVPFLLGFQDIALPLQSVELYVTKAHDDLYQYEIVFQAVNDHAAAALSLLIGNIFHADIAVEGSAIFIKNGEITEKRLVELLPFRHNI